MRKSRCIYVHGEEIFDFFLPFRMTVLFKRDFSNFCRSCKWIVHVGALELNVEKLY